MTGNRRAALAAILTLSLLAFPAGADPATLGKAPRDPCADPDLCESIAAPPANDGFANAIAIGALPYTNSQSTVDATVEASEPSPCGAIAATVWYSITPGSSGLLTVNTFGSDFDTVVAAYTGASLATLTNVACNDDTGSGLQSRITFSATAGTTYSIQVGGFSGDVGALELEVEDAGSAPANDDFADATQVSSVPYTKMQGTGGATMEAGEPDPCFVVGATVWFSFVPAASGVVVVDTFGSDFDTVLAAYTGASLGGLTDLACNDDTGGDLQSRISFSATAGTTYSIQVGGYLGDTGSLVLNVDLVTPPANDDFANAIAIGATPYTNTQATAGATLEAGEPAPCGLAGAGASVWYEFTPAFAGILAADTFGSDFDTVLAVYSGASVGALTSLACNDDAGATLQSQVSLSVQAGVTYRIQASGYGGDSGSLTLDVALGQNDCGTGGDAAGTHAAANAIAEPVTCTGHVGGTDGQDWYQFAVGLGDTITASVPVGFTICLHDPSGTLLSCGASVSAGPVLTPGQYRVQVSGGNGAYTMSVRSCVANLQGVCAL